MATGQGTVTFNFGIAPGTNVVSTTVSDTGVGATSKVEIYLMGTDSTVEHNMTEHQLLPLGGLSLSCTAITAGVGFTAQAATLLRLTGNIKARYVWAD
jgi:hypothetical protein